MSYAGIWQFGPLVLLSKEAIKEMDHTEAGKKVPPLGLLCKEATQGLCHLAVMDLASQQCMPCGMDPTPA